MAKEVTARAATIDEATDKALAELGASRQSCEIEVLESPRKTLFGKLKEAVVRVSVREDAPGPEPEKPARPAGNRGEKLALVLEYLDAILAAMGLSEVGHTVEEKEEGGALITLTGEGLAVLIGRHGETLDSLQYLAVLAGNRAGGDYYRITLDCGDYRKKRELALQNLAVRIAHKAQKTGRSQLLEPMNPYERRIIHSAVSAIEGVASKSKGEEPNRRVVVFSEHPAPRAPHTGAPQHTGAPHTNGAPRGRGHRGALPRRELTMEEILKGEFKQEFREREENAELYSKIEFRD